MQILIGQPGQEELQPIERSLLRQFCTEYSSKSISTIQELKLLKQQNDMIKQIRKNIVEDRKRVCVTECSQNLSELSLSSRIDDQENWVKLKPRKRVPLSSCEVNLTERSNKQSKELKKLEYYESEARYYENLYKKSQKARDDLKEKYCLAERKIAQQDIIIKNLKTLVSSYEQKNKIREAINKSSTQVDVRRLEAALMVRQKLVQSDIKRLNNLKKHIEKERQQQNNQRECLDSLWEETMSRVDDGFRRDVLAKCKESLMKQRDILATQQAQLDKKHEEIERLIRQLQH